MEAPFRAYDVRGIVDDDITPEFAKRLGNGVAQYLKTDTLIVGRDIRPSSKALSEALIQGMNEVGVDVIDIGECTTPMVYFAINNESVGGGVMITASHNPPEYNGFKICGPHAVPIDAGNGLPNVEALTKNPVSQKEGDRIVKDVQDEYISHVLTFAQDTGSSKIVMDGGNATAGLVVPAIFENTEIQRVPLYLKPDGSFPNHHPNPMIDKNTIDLRQKVVQEKADAGFTWDGDSDRFFICDEKGQMIAPDVFFAFMVDSLLENGKIVKNALCGHIVDDVADGKDISVHKERVGHGFIKRAMRDQKADLGAEHSAHYYFKKNWYAYDGLIASVIAASIISKGDAPLSERIKPYQTYKKSGEINFEVEDRDAVVQAVQQAYPPEKQDTIDGITIDLGSGWFNIRKSNSEPVVRLNVEAETEEQKDALLSDAKAIINGAS